MWEDFKTKSQEIFGERVYFDYLRRFAYGVDASCYRYVPKAVIIAQNEEEILALLKIAKAAQVSLTFRASGTSLSGQASAKDVLVISHFDEISITQEAKSVFCGCGAIGQSVNDALKSFGKKIGPDPATIASARIGGIFSNNSSGMCCGVKQNSYQTIKSIRVILENGSILDTSTEASYQSFARENPQIISQLLSLRQEILEDLDLCRKIRKKYSIKNTTGYSLNALLDFEDPKDILNHIFIGAEGTLGFVSRVEYECVQDPAHKACALLFFDDIHAASEAVLLFARHQDIISAAEIMDYACLESVRHLSGLPEEMQRLREGNCAILIQLEAGTKEALDHSIEFLSPQIQALQTLFEVRFSFDKKEQDSWWLIRKGILPIAAAKRPEGSSVITEDICFFIEDFTQGIAKIIDLLKRFDFDGIIFGHALSGNVHFIITPNLNLEAQARSFVDFMEALAKCVTEFEGSIKAEHGTGRMVAPFVELELGAKAYAINQKIKNIFDSQCLFNPDVILSQDKQIHLKNLKPSLEHFKGLSEMVGKCMECGFCEKHCPSRNLTLSPRQRIAVFLEIQRLKEKASLSLEEKAQLHALQEGFEYYGLETCATCSACANLCPIKIDTANLCKNLTHGKHPKIANFIASHMGLASAVLKSSIKLSSLLPFRQNLSQKFHAWFKTPIIPQFMPSSNPIKHFSSTQDRPHHVVYFTSCLNRIFAPSPLAKDKRPIQEAFLSLAKKADYSVIYPQDIKNLCCSKAYKDYKEVAQNTAKRTFEALLKASHQGEIPIVCDHSACSLELLERAREFGIKQGVTLKIFDMPSFLLEHFIPRLKIQPSPAAIGIYAPCATRHYKQERDNQEALLTLAGLCAENVIFHTETKCCGFAGNKGFLNPSLNAFALRDFKKFFAKTGFDEGFSTSSTCEIGLSEHTGRAWSHILYLLDKNSQARG